MTVAFDICTRRVGDDEHPQQPCEDCGHTRVLHPGPANPKLTECQICLLRSHLAQGS